MNVIRFLKIILGVFVLAIVCSYFLIFCVNYFALSSLGVGGGNQKVTQNQPARSQGQMAIGTSAPLSSVTLSRTSLNSGQFEKSEISVPDRHRRAEVMIKFFNEFEELRKDSRLQSAPHLCRILCSASTYKRETEQMEVWDRLSSFLEKEGSRAFDDPGFRLAIEFFNSFADMMVVINQASKEIEPSMKPEHELTTSEKLFWSAKAPIWMARLTRSIKKMAKESTKRVRIIGQLKELSKQCAERSLAEIEAECYSLSGQFQ